MIKAVMRDYEKKSTTSTNAISSCGPAMLSELLLLLRLAWRVQRVKGRILLWDFRGCSGLTLTSPIRSSPLRDLDGGKTGRVENLIGEGRKPDIDDDDDDDDARVHSVLGVEGMTTLHRHQNQVITTKDQAGQNPSEHRTFCIRFVLL